MPARRQPRHKRWAKEAKGAWVPVWGRRRGLPSRIFGRDSRGRFAWIVLPPEARWRFYAGPPWVTYHREGRYRIEGRHATAAQAQWVIASMVEGSLEDPPASWKGDLDPAIEDVEGDDKVTFEANDADMSLEDVQAAYELAGAWKDGNEAEDDIDEVEVEFSGETEERLEQFHAFELRVRNAKLGRWSLLDKKIGLAVSYYAVAHKLTYADRSKFGVVIRTPFAPIGREAYGELRDRMEKAQAKSEEDVEFVVGGIFVIVKVLT